MDSKETYHPTQGFVHHVLIAAKMQKKLYSPGIEGIIGVERVRITANTENVDDEFPGTRWQSILIRKWSSPFLDWAAWPYLTVGFSIFSIIISLLIKAARGTRLSRRRLPSPEDIIFNSNILAFGVRTSDLQVTDSLVSKAYHNPTFQVLMVIFSPTQLKHNFLDIRGSPRIYQTHQFRWRENQNSTLKFKYFSFNHQLF